MRRLLYGSLTVAATLTATVALAAPAFAADSPAAPAGCGKVYTLAQHRGYARSVFRRTHIKHRAFRRLLTMRQCQGHGYRARRAALRTERKLRRWRSLYHCTQGKVVNCIRDATRVYGGSLSHALACARSESGLNPYARGGGGASGTFQFMPGTFATTLHRMGVGPKSIYSARWNSRAAAWKFVHDGYGEWGGAGC
jgi:soluble lytic murein transglycosylase-like protein